MSTLYRDYRPQNFSEVLGQKHIKITLQNEIGAGKLAQAFLFCGPRAVGKTTLARVLAKSVNCLARKEGEYEPCGHCANCLSIAGGNNLDIIEIDAASNTGVDNVRENIISFSRLAPSVTKYKVFIIDEVHMLSPSAFNALLKTIEEPPSYVIFILCTTEIHKVPLTIISRCERFDFRRISISDIVKKLRYISDKEKIEIDDEVLEAAARKSGGHLRDAESLLGQIFSLGDKRITLEQAELVIPHYNSSEAVDLLEHLARKDAAKAINLINSLIDSGTNIRNFNSDLISLLRKMILSKVNPELSDSFGLNLGDSLEIRVNGILGLLTLDNLVFYTRRLLESYNEKNQLILQLPLELAIIEICLGEKNIGRQLSEEQFKSLIVEPQKTVAPNLNSTLASKPTSSSAKIEPAKIKLTNPAPDLNQSDILEKWPEFLVKIKKHNHSLSFVLQNCEPQSLHHGILCLLFKYKFHQDRVGDNSIKSIIESTLAEVFGGAVALNSRLDENLEIKKNQSVASVAPDLVSPDLARTDLSAGVADIKKDSGAMMNNLLEAFGGEVIN
ncbi:MAG TPA: DNA polymerase III subunit gamma/tau [Candidatus Saccharimonadales bacterium]|nr:DNA polymerase III subunit gamma/tau [Candidatus Saccharimonadales bacterium]